MSYTYIVILEYIIVSLTVKVYRYTQVLLCIPFSVSFKTKITTHHYYIVMITLPNNLIFLNLITLKCQLGEGQLGILNGIIYTCTCVMLWSDISL